MAKFGSIDFDNHILDAISEKKLVIFAGAGVSMGAPSNLPSFEKLANDIASGTGFKVTIPIDRFLGQLDDKGVKVHDRAAKLLSQSGSEPTALHQNILHMFGSAENVRLVTTNFDLHFETAALILFENQPETYRAPALPLGSKFKGIVHVHGSLIHPHDMVLTDSDFGRAYLTEGWARRFLAEIFQHYTVLFIGYRHNDVVINYLARALPANNTTSRFILTDDDKGWDFLGIKSILYKKGDGDDPYRELIEGVGMLAERVNRGALDWQARITHIGRGAPPSNDETAEEIEQSLRKIYPTQYLTEVAKDAEWVKWLDARKYLDALFCVENLNERDRMLALWLAQDFAIERPDAIFDLIAAHGLRLNPAFWWSIGRSLSTSREKTIEEIDLKRWVTIMLASAPDEFNPSIMLGLAQQCSDQHEVNLTLMIFLFLIRHRLNIKPGFVWRDSEDNEHGRHLKAECPLRADFWLINEIWSKHLKPHISLVTQALLAGIARRFEEIHQDLMAWSAASRDWDPISINRTAIETIEQDYSEAIDVLIDAARDSLEWLATDSPSLFDSWADRFVASDVPILRRLAIYAVTSRARITADEHITWLMDHIRLESYPERSEIRRVLTFKFPAVSAEMQKVIVDAVLAIRLSESGEWSAEKRTCYAHFEWFTLLLKAKPDCQLVESQLESIKEIHPEWWTMEKDDFLQDNELVKLLIHQSPWTVEQLLLNKPGEQIDDLLSFEGSRHFDGPDRDGLISTIKDACTQDTCWAFAIAHTLEERSLWESDLWPAIIRGWQESNLPLDEWRVLLVIIANPELIAAYSYEVANLLESIVANGGKPFALDLLDQANALAYATWQSIESNEPNEDIQDWFFSASNHEASILVNFWIVGLSLLMDNRSGSKQIMPDDYCDWFTQVVHEPYLKGSFGRYMLTRHSAFLFSLNEDWTIQYLVPLFIDKDRNKFGPAWNGLLFSYKLHSALLDILIPAFVSAVSRMDADLPSNCLRRFIQVYTELAVYHVDNPMQQFLPELIRNGSLEDRVIFATHLAFILRNMNPEVTHKLWDRWLRCYWQERVQGVPAVLSKDEFQRMLTWLPRLDDSFPEAVLLIVRSPAIRIKFHYSLLDELLQGDLVARYQTETAELLIYLCDNEDFHDLSKLRDIDSLLPELAPDLRHRLDEALARIGAK